MRSPQPARPLGPEGRGVQGSATTLVENGAEGLSLDMVWGQGYILRETLDYQVLEKVD